MGLREQGRGAGLPSVLRRTFERVQARLRGERPRGSAEDHRAFRHEILARSRDVSASQGLEIGVGGLATIPPQDGDCERAEFRVGSADAGQPEEPAVRHAIDREKPLHRQIPREFDYIVLHHVLERAPDPVGLIEDLVDMLRPEGHLLIALPDKRRTRDAARPSARLEELLDALHRRVSRPSFQQILDSERAGSEAVESLARQDPRSYYALGAKRVDRAGVEARCHVWADADFFEQLLWLVRGGFLGPVAIDRLDGTSEDLDDFHVLLRRDEALVAEPEGRLLRAPRSQEYGTHVFFVEKGRRRWITSPGVREAIGMDDARISFVSERMLERIPLGEPLELVDEDEAGDDAPRWRGPPPATAKGAGAARGRASD